MRRAGNRDAHGSLTARDGAASVRAFHICLRAARLRGETETRAGCIRLAAGRARPAVHGPVDSSACRPRVAGHEVVHETGTVAAADGLMPALAWPHATEARPRLLA